MKYIRAGSADGGTSFNQNEGGGSIPASALFFHGGREDEAAALVMKYHYSRRIPSNIQFIGTLHTSGGLFGNCGPAICACIFSIPPTRWSEPALELSRLVRADGLQVPLSFLIRMTIGLVKRSKQWPLLVSFADSTQGHHGGIYQASGWDFDGRRESQMDGVIVDGTFVPGRSANSRWGTRSPERLAARGVIAEPHYDEGKYIYWRALNRAGIESAKRLGLKSMPYPKPKAGAA